MAKQATSNGAGGRIRRDEILAAIYNNRLRCPECKQAQVWLDPKDPDKGVLPIEHTAKCKRGKDAADRRDDLRRRLDSALKGGDEKRAEKQARRQRKEQEAMASRKATAEAMSAAELKDALKAAGVKGYSRLGHAELVDLYLDTTKPAKASKASSNGEPREWAPDQERIIPVMCESADGKFSLKSGSGNWNAIRSRIGRYFRDEGADKDEVRAALDTAKEKFDGGQQSTTVKVGKFSVSIKALTE